ncbi:DUF2442 domain-containing protein [Thiomicrorhabdus aquaedulcis]|uniref:DUF2442 domain-containing protein n=1 Tax=Thiomicrorhabdus aquaedulcis TaxID=2211106 RepID=UPI000FD95347|nr:DUF2442 domain-containing protein [Thiomicrorhabdus aquaedulcis]
MHLVSSVKPLDNYQLAVTFKTGEERLFDVSPFLEKGVFVQLKNPDFFRRAFIAWDTVCWPNELDISPDTIYLCSKPLQAAQ